MKKSEEAGQYLLVDEETSSRSDDGEVSIPAKAGRGSRRRTIDMVIYASLFFSLIANALLVFYVVRLRGRENLRRSLYGSFLFMSLTVGDLLIIFSWFRV